MRTQRLSEMNSHLGFNPITGEVRDATRITYDLNPLTVAATVPLLI
jgi:hypothetical protein